MVARLVQVQVQVQVKQAAVIAGLFALHCVGVAECKSTTGTCSTVLAVTVPVLVKSTGLPGTWYKCTCKQTVHVQVRVLVYKKRLLQQQQRHKDTTGCCAQRTV